MICEYENDGVGKGFLRGRYPKITSISSDVIGSNYVMQYLTNVHIPVLLSYRLTVLRNNNVWGEKKNAKCKIALPCPGVPGNLVRLNLKRSKRLKRLKRSKRKLPDLQVFILNLDFMQHTRDIYQQHQHL